MDVYNEKLICDYSLKNLVNNKISNKDDGNPMINEFRIFQSINTIE